MEQNFQTSFIPKKPVVVERARPTARSGIFLVFSVLVFLAVAVAYGGVYFYQNSLTQSIASKQKALELAKNRFEPGRISELDTLDRRISAAKSILSRHVAVSPIFAILENTTLPGIRYTSFTYELSDAGKVTVKLSGESSGYRGIALQSDLLTEDKDVLDPVFSNLSLDNRGNVLFDLTFSVRAELVNYASNLARGGYVMEAAPAPEFAPTDAMQLPETTPLTIEPATN